MKNSKLKNVTNMRKTNKNKHGFYIFVLFISMFFVLGLLSNCSFGKSKLITREIVIGKNDTIWDISMEICNNSEQKLNVQSVVAKIKKINNLNGSEIFVGQVLKIPIY